MSSSGESSADLQRDAEAERAELVSTLDQLRENLKPANVIDEVMGSAKITTAEISEKVWQTARSNPIPSAFIALGAAMLLGVGQKVRKAATQATDDGASRSVTDAVRSKIDRAADITRTSLSEADKRAAVSAAQIERSARTLRREASRAPVNSWGASRGTPSKSEINAMSSYRSRDQLTGSLFRFIEEQPLVLAAVGIAVGAAIGASIPSTETESRLMGDASVTLKSRAQDLAQAELAHIKETASSTLDQLKQKAADHGVSKDNLTDLVQESGAAVRGAVQDVADHAASTAGLKS